MLQLASITDKNINMVVDECFSELRLREEAIFYYDFLSIVQWLAVTVICSDKEGEDPDNNEEESLLIVEKMKYLVSKVMPPS